MKKIVIIDHDLNRIYIFEGFHASFSFDDRSFFFMSYVMDMDVVTCTNSPSSKVIFFKHQIKEFFINVKKSKVVEG